MAGQIMRFQFHKLVGVQILTDHPEDAAFFQNEYERHSVAQIPDGLPKVSIHYQRWNGFTPLPSGFTSHSHKFIARWGYRFRLSEEKIAIEVLGNRSAVPMVHHMLLHPSLRYLSSLKGTLMLHAGSVACRGASLIFTGHGGAGKTTATSVLLAAEDESWHPHADDYVFLRPGPKSLAYITRSHLYKDLLRWIPKLKNRLTIVERLQLELYGNLRAWSGQKITLPVRLSFDRLWPNREVQQSAVPAAIVVLQPKPQNSAELGQLRGDELPLDSLIEINFQEARHFLNLVEKSATLKDFPGWKSEWRGRERRLLSRLFSEIPVYVLQLPRHLAQPDELYRELSRHLFNLLPAEDQPDVAARE
jgi:hypothetical protein